MEECLVFVVDVDPEIAQEAGVQGSTRLDIIRSSICMFVHAKVSELRVASNQQALIRLSLPYMCMCRPE